MKKRISLLPYLLFGCLLAVSGNLYASSRAIGDLTLHFVNVGQGDSTFIDLPDGRNILIDAGSPAGGPQVVNYLRSLGTKRINHFILTHPHDDHIGGVFNIMSAFEVEYIYDNGFSNFQSTMYGDYIKLIRHDISRYKILQNGETLNLDDLHINVLNPLLPPTGNFNNDSVVLKVTYGDIKILLAGDIGNLGEQRLIDSNVDLASHILKIGHHGDDSASSKEFLKKVNPETAIISVGKMNKYAKPHQRLLGRLKEKGIVIYRTDKNGTIVVKTDGKKYSIQTVR